jgi:Neuraminidase (sialidase)
VRLKPLRFGIAALSVMVAAASPLHAMASGAVSSDLMAAKGFDVGTPNALPDLLNDDGTPTIGDAAGGGQAALGHGRGVQVNDPNLDNIQFFPNALPQPQRPYEFSIQSETSMATFGNDVIVGFNNSADQPVTLSPQNTVAFQHRFLSGVGVSHDGGRTFTESSLPPIPGSPFTFGDPALAADRQGNFYYASLGANAAGQSLIFVGKTTDRGRTFQPGSTVAIDPGSDKEWIAVGKDPLNPQQDNVYVTWTSFKANSSQLMMGKSTDGGQTWTISTLFAPVDNGVESAFIQFSNPVVDQRTGRLFVPFLHGGDTDADYIKVLVSDDGGQTFHFSNFNVPGAPSPAAFPNVTPGTAVDCGVRGGIRLTLHQGPDLGGGRAGFPVFRQATRLITQPSATVADGKLFIALNSSTSAVVGDPTSTSFIRVLVSPDGGGTWQGPFTVAPATAAQPQHVHPSISTDRSGRQVTVGYYSQLASGKLRFDATTAQLNREDGQTTLSERRSGSLGPAFDLIPANNPLPAVFGAHTATNYDRTIQACYNLGEYTTAARSGDDHTIFAFGDDRNTWTGPAASIQPGTHTQPDVFAVRAHTDD